MFKKIKRHCHELLHPYNGEVWCLHRVIEKRTDFGPNRELEITPSYLESLIIERQNSGYSFVHIDEILNARKHLFPKKKINISFDDGFSDIYNNAFPIFKKYNVPFTLYLTTNFPDMKADIWWIQLEKHSDRERLMKLIYSSGNNMRDTMHNLTGTEADVTICKKKSLTWSQIQEMVNSGLCEIGSHTVSHPSLTRISIDEVRMELIESKKIIENHIGKRVHHFSYPHSMQNKEIIEEVRNCGYDSAVLVGGGKIRYGDYPYLLNRIYITQ